MRLALSASIALLGIASGLACSVGCSPSPGSVTLPAQADGAPVTREYPFECALPAPAETSGTATFTSIYTEIVSDQTGVAKCQNGACHGNGASNGDLSLGTTKKDAYCGMVDYQLIRPLDCTTCSLCAEEVKGATAGACGDDAGIVHGCCVPCSAGSDAGTDAASDAATDGSSPSEVPDEVAVFHDIVAPNSKGAIRMPKILCGNRPLDDRERAAIRAWGNAGAPLD